MVYSHPYEEEAPVRSRQRARGAISYVGSALSTLYAIRSFRGGSQECFHRIHTENERRNTAQSFVVPDRNV